MTQRQFLETVRYGVIAGTAGGLAEVLWVTLYAGGTGTSSAAIARGVTTAAGVAALLPAFPAGAGLAVHMMLAVMLGIGLAFFWRALSSRWPQLVNPFPLVVAVLVVVWAVNFFVILPIVSPAFVHLVPYTVSFTSKLLFGLAAAETFRRQATLKFRHSHRSPTNFASFANAGD